MIASHAVLRAIRLMLDAPAARAFWGARLLEVTADWVFLVALLVLAYDLTADVSVVALLLLARLLPRLLALLPSFGPQARPAAAWDRAARGIVPAGLVLVDASGDLWWAAAAVFVSGILAGASDAAHAAAVRATAQPTVLGAAGTFNQMVERVGITLGPLAGAALVALGSIDAALLVAAAGLVLSSVGRRPAGATREPATAALGLPRERRPELLVLVVALFLGALVAVATLATLPARLDTLDGRSPRAPGLFLAVVGVGMLLGPLHVPRLLGRFPVGPIVGGCVAGSAVAMALIERVDSTPLIVVALFGMGLLTLTGQAVAAAATRRIVPAAALAGVLRLLAGAVAAGQVAGAAAVAGVARWGIVDNLLLVLGLVCLGLLAPVVLLQLTFGRAPERVVAAPK